MNITKFFWGGVVRNTQNRDTENKNIDKNDGTVIHYRKEMKGVAPMGR